MADISYGKSVSGASGSEDAVTESKRKKTVHGRIIKDTGLFALANIFSQIVAVLRGLIIPNILGPAYFGLLNGLSVILDHTQYSHFGISNGMSYRIPFYRVKSDNEAVVNMRNATFTTSVITGAAASMLILAALFVMGRNFSTPLKTGLIILSVLVFVQNMRIFIVYALQADHRFKLLSFINILESSASAVCIISLGLLFNIYGVLIGMLLANTVCLLVALYRSRYSFRWCLKKKVIKDLLGVGFPLFLVGILHVFFLGLDRILIVKYLGSTDLGYYALSLTFVMYLQMIPNIFAKVLTPRIYEEASKEAGNLKQYLVDPLQSFAFYSVTLVGGVYIMLPWILRTVFPAYLHSIESGGIILCRTFFTVIALVPFQILIGKRKIKLILLSQAAGLCIAFFWGVSVLGNGGDIRSMAFVMFAAHFAYAFMLLYCASRLVLSSPAKVFYFFLKLALICAYSVIFVLSVKYFSRSVFPFIGHKPGTVFAVELFVFAFCILPLYYFVSKKSWVFREIMKSNRIFFFLSRKSVEQT